MDKTLIPNGQIEQMFLRICTDEQMVIFVNHFNSGNIALATAYASRIVTKRFFSMIEEQEEETRKRKL